MSPSNVLGRLLILTKRRGGRRLLPVLPARPTFICVLALMHLKPVLPCGRYGRQCKTRRMVKEGRRMAPLGGIGRSSIQRPHTGQARARRKPPTTISCSRSNPEYPPRPIHSESLLANPLTLPCGALLLPACTMPRPTQRHLLRSAALSVSSLVSTRDSWRVTARMPMPAFAASLGQILPH